MKQFKKEKERKTSVVFICIRTKACDYNHIRGAYRVNNPPNLFVVVVVIIIIIITVGQKNERKMLLKNTKRKKKTWSVFVYSPTFF
jgi:hypothetical protein